MYTYGQLLALVTGTVSPGLQQDPKEHAVATQLQLEYQDLLSRLIDTVCMSIHIFWRSTSHR